MISPINTNGSPGAQASSQRNTKKRKNDGSDGSNTSKRSPSPQNDVEASRIIAAIEEMFINSTNKCEDIAKEITRLGDYVKECETKMETSNQTASSIGTEAPTEFVPSNKVQQLFISNMRASNSAEAKLDFLLYKHDDTLEKKPRQPHDYEFFKENERIYQEILPELTTIIRERVSNVERKARENGSRFKKLRYEWWERNRITIDDVRNEDVRFFDQLAKTPAMLSEEEKRNCFVSRNGMMTSEQVLQEYQEQRVLEETWTEEEKRIFIDKFTKTPKDMRVIASYLPNKTTGDVVTFYYNYKMTEDFKKMKKELKLSNKYRKRFVDEGTRKSHDREPLSPLTPSEPIFNRDFSKSASSSDLRTATSSSRSKNERSKKEDEEATSEWSQAEISKYKSLVAKFGVNFEKIAQKLKTKDEEQVKQFYEDIKNNIKYAQPTKDKKKKTTPSISITQPVSSPMKKASKETLEKKDGSVLPPPSSSGITKPSKTKRVLKIVSIWTVSERDAFLEYFREYGRDWKKLAELIPTKTETQIRNLFLNYKVKLGLSLPTMRRKKKKSPIPYVETNPEVATPDLFTLSVLACDIHDKGDEMDQGKPQQRTLSSSLQVSNSQLRKSSKKAKKKSKVSSPGTGNMDLLATVSCNQAASNEVQYIPSLQDLIQSQTNNSNPPFTPQQPIEYSAPQRHTPPPQHFYSHQSGNQMPPMVHSEEHQYHRSNTPYDVIQPNIMNNYPVQQNQSVDVHDTGIIMRTLVNQQQYGVPSVTNMLSDPNHHVVNDINLTSNEVLTPLPSYQIFHEKLSRLPGLTDNLSHPMSEMTSPKKSKTTEIVLDEGGFVDYDFGQQAPPPSFGMHRAINPPNNMGGDMPSLGSPYGLSNSPMKNIMHQLNHPPMQNHHPPNQ